jgi:hypothetical protein
MPSAARNLLSDAPGENSTVTVGGDAAESGFLAALEMTEFEE